MRHGESAVKRFLPQNETIGIIHTMHEVFLFDVETPKAPAKKYCNRSKKHCSIYVMTFHILQIGLHAEIQNKRKCSVNILNNSRVRKFAAVPVQNHLDRIK